MNLETLPEVEVEDDPTRITNQERIDKEVADFYCSKSEKFSKKRSKSSHSINRYGKISSKSRPRRQKSRYKRHEIIIEEVPIHSKNIAPCLKKRRQDLNKCLEVYDIKLHKLRLKLKKLEKENERLKKHGSFLEKKLHSKLAVEDQSIQVVKLLNKSKKRDKILGIDLEKIFEVFVRISKIFEKIKVGFFLDSSGVLRSNGSTETGGKSSFETELELNKEIDSIGIESALKRMRCLTDNFLKSKNADLDNYINLYKLENGFESKKIQDPEVASEAIHTNQDLRKQVCQLKADLHLKNLETVNLKSEFWKVHKELLDLKSTLRDKERQFEKQTFELEIAQSSRQGQLDFENSISAGGSLRKQFGSRRRKGGFENVASVLEFQVKTPCKSGLLSSGSGINFSHNRAQRLKNLFNRNTGSRIEEDLEESEKEAENGQDYYFEVPGRTSDEERNTELLMTHDLKFCKVSPEGTDRHSQEMDGANIGGLLASRLKKRLGQLNSQSSAVLAASDKIDEVQADEIADMLLDV